MKFIHKVRLLVSVFFYVCMASSASVHASHDTLSFNQVYSLTPYKKVLHSCMHAWQCMRDVAEEVAANEHEMSEQMCYIVLGYLTRAYDLVKQHVQSNACTSDGYAYLAHVCTCIRNEYNRVTDAPLATVCSSLQKKITQLQTLFMDYAE